jgi:hypothetical protein
MSDIFPVLTRFNKITRKSRSSKIMPGNASQANTEKAAGKASKHNAQG